MTNKNEPDSEPDGGEGRKQEPKADPTPDIPCIERFRAEAEGRTLSRRLDAERRARAGEIASPDDPLQVCVEDLLVALDNHDAKICFALGKPLETERLIAEAAAKTVDAIDCAMRRVRSIHAAPDVTEALEQLRHVFLRMHELREAEVQRAIARVREKLTALAGFNRFGRACRAAAKIADGPPAQAGETAACGSGHAKSAPDSSAAESAIPNLSSPHSLKEIAAAIGGCMTVKRLRKAIDNGRIRVQKINRQTYAACLDDLSAEAKKKLAPSAEN